MAERLVTIATFNELTEAHILKGRLEAEGILCFLGDEHIVGVHPFYSVAVGGVKLKVTEGDVMEAKAILARIQEGSSQFDYDSIDMAPPVQEQPRSLVCPNCGSDNVGELGIPMPFMSRRYTCYNCSHAWKERK
ncbi:putative signal transducing protein [Pontibacter flavimaris]|uniref:DUF2007 domain-containing protein n=1 Tax=Pontibacter flavimaris TaxID=1797110 RepID=A0A1Q5PHW0_9BACT|nr:DUF2007 domain-containing protein [Pontibacter flavimaris]OKL41813.1 hypothetical protein A3841_07260 [Pontibacter flavimaris]